MDYNIIFKIASFYKLFLDQILIYYDHLLTKTLLNVLKTSTFHLIYIMLY